MYKLKLLYFKIVALFKLIIFFIVELKKIKNAEVIFFFPFYHTGGAEKVHLDIVTAISNHNIYIMFTNKSESIHYKNQFYTLANCYEVFEFLNRNFFVKKMFIKVIAKNLNQSKKLLSIFGCNSMFYYDFLPFLSSSIKKIDLIHAFSKPDYGLELYSLSRVKFLNTRVVINKKTLNDFSILYSENELIKFLDRIILIPNGLHIPNNSLSKKPIDSFEVLYVGRWAKEKRPEIFIAIAKKVKKTHPTINFTMVGTNFEANKNIIFNAGINNKGVINNEKVLVELYNNANIILVTSYREGFPLVIMESMRNGVVPISTNVGGIGEHIIDGFNGFLIENNDDVESIIDKFVQKIVELYNDDYTFTEVSRNAYLYAKNEFDINNFNKKYNTLLLN